MEGPSAPTMHRDPYEVLSVSRDSTDQEIKTAYRKLALNKLGVLIKTTISANDLEEGLNGTVTVRPLPFGKSISGKVDKQCAHFFGVTISDEQAEFGIVVRVTSTAQSKFKATHYSENKGWSTPDAQASYEKMVELQSIPVEDGTEPKSIDNIVDEVLGTMSGYIKGLGYGPKPSSSRSKANHVDLEESLKKTQDELQQYKSTFEKFESQIQAMTNALIAAGIHVPFPQFSASSGATNSTSIQSPSTEDLN